MKQTKRSIMIPEDHYVQLTKLISGNDSVQVERAKTDQQIQKILKSNLSDLVKNVQYNLLAKKRTKLSQTLKKKPTEQIDALVKKLMEELKGKPSKEEDVSATGIVPPSVPKQNLQEIQKQVVPRVHKPLAADPHLETEEDDEEPWVEEDPKDEDIPAPKDKKLKNQLKLEQNIETVTKFHAKINKKYYNDLKNYLADNRKAFGISEDGKIFTNVSEAKTGYSSKTFTGSNVNFVIRILVGMEDVPKIPDQLKYVIALYKRLQKDATIKQMINNNYKGPMEGQGKGSKVKNVYVLDIRKRKGKNIEQTKGLPRQRINNRIKPMLWTKIGV